MIRLERLRILAVSDAPGRYELEVERDGRIERAIAYAALLERPSAGDTALCNTTAVELGLGTGGVHLVVAVEGHGASIGTSGHAMKARYLPQQLAVDAVEQEHADRIDAPEALEGARIVACPLHSLIAPVAIAVRAVQPRARIVYLMTDHAALPLAFSDLVPAMRAAGLLDATITCGQAFGGELEAVSIHSGLLAARRVTEADVIIVAMGPGNLGTASRFGFAGIGTVDVLNAAHALRGDASLCARVSFADARPRHRAISHHTRTIIEMAASQVRLPLPILADATHAAELASAAASLAGAAVLDVEVEPVVRAFEEHVHLLRSMGRGFAEDPAFFLAGAAAGLDALH